MKIDNKTDGMRLNRFISKPWVIPGLLFILDIILILVFSYAINSCANIGEYYTVREQTGYDFANLTPAQELRITNLRKLYFGLGNIIPHPFSQGKAIKMIYTIGFLFLLGSNFLTMYKVKTSYGEKAINWNQYGEARFTTKNEIKQQYIGIDNDGSEYDGVPGIAVTSMKVKKLRVKDLANWDEIKRMFKGQKKLFIDSSNSNTLIVGGTRSGKGEIYVFRNTWIDAFAKDIKNRSSLIITDLKLELYKSMKGALEKQGYIVRLLNLDDPSKSMGYNPLSIVVDEYKRGNHSKAKNMARAFAFSIFHSDSVQEKDPLWSNTATDLFTALIIAQVSDAIYLDELEAKKREKMYKSKREAFDDLDDPMKIKVQTESFYKLKNQYDDIDVLYEKAAYIPPEEEYVPYEDKYEKNVNVYSCLNFFRELCDREKLKATDKEDHAKKAENALDSYFNARPKLDFAAALYSEIKNSADKTKGSIYVNMQSALSIFNLDNIAQMTAANDVDIKDIGYGDRPVAIFIGVPFEDKSNHFLATTFISQVSQYLSQYAKESRGELKRIVRFRLDEFGNFPVIENFGNLITAGLSYGMRFEIYLQSLEQLFVKYGEDEGKNILNNCNNKIYIMSGDKKAAEYFSELCGDKTIIDISRNGNLHSIEKNYTENAKGVPLISTHELMKLKEGETLFVRKNTRTDLNGVAIDSTPILNEYADMPGFFNSILIFFNVLRSLKNNRGLMQHPNSELNRKCTFEEQYKIFVNNWRIENGTAFVYRYKDEALKDIFDNPKSIDFNKICDEDLSHIDYTKRVLDPLYILDLIKKDMYYIDHNDYEVKKQRVKDLANWEEIKRMFRGQKNWLINYGLSDDLTPEVFTRKVRLNKKMDETTKKSLLHLLQSEVSK